MSADFLSKWLYFGTALSIILIILTILQLNQISQDYVYSDIATLHMSKYNTSHNDLAYDLEQIRNELLLLDKYIVDSNDLTPMIDSSIESLAKFINDNPKLNSTALCSIELRDNIINQELDNSITPNENTYAKSYDTILDWGSEEELMHKNSREHLKFLIKNLNIAIGLLRKKVCNNGHLDLSKLRSLLYNLNDQVKKTGMMKYSNAKIVYNKPSYVRYDTPPKIPLFLQTDTSVEPFKNSFKNSFNKSKKEAMTPLQSTDRLVYTNDYTVPTPSYKPMDISFEGITERDINNNEEFGHTLNSSDISHYYTVRSGACGGTTPSDEQFFTQCTGKDLELVSALNGNASKMLDCIGDCTSEPNYFRWYNQLSNTVTGIATHGIEDYN